MLQLDKYGRAKITDFGLSTVRKETFSQSMTSRAGGHKLVGSLHWMAPELFAVGFGQKPYSAATDAYAFGVVLCVW